MGTQTSLPGPHDWRGKGGDVHRVQVRDPAHTGGMLHHAVSPRPHFGRHGRVRDAKGITDERGFLLAPHVHDALAGHSPREPNPVQPPTQVSLRAGATNLPPGGNEACSHVSRENAAGVGAGTGALGVAPKTLRFPRKPPVGGVLEVVLHFCQKFRPGNVDLWKN